MILLFCSRSRYGQHGTGVTSHPLTSFSSQQEQTTSNEPSTQLSVVDWFTEDEIPALFFIHA